MACRSAAIADSGKKHVIPWAPLNPAGCPAGQGRVMFEERLVMLGDWTLVDALSGLLTAGATKDEIERGAYGPGAWTRLGAAAIRDFERTWSGSRGGGWFALAVGLAQRDEQRGRGGRFPRDRKREEKCTSTRPCASDFVI